MSVPTSYFLVVAAILFSIGTAGVLLRRNVIVVFMSVELMLNAVNLTFVALARATGTMDGHVAVLFVIVVAAAEASIGLAIILANFSQRRTVNADEIGLLHG